jgi:transposase
MRFDLSDEEWAAIVALLPPATHGRRIETRPVML